jgi:copper(I)-binding protein
MAATRNTTRTFPPTRTTNTPFPRRLGPLCVAILLATAQAARAAPPDVTVTQAQIRVILPSRPAVAYFTLSNQGATRLVLSGASAPDCQSLMMHQSTTRDGIDRMEMVDSLPVPPHGSVSFSPGAYHLMCIQPSGALLARKGLEPVTLHFTDGTSVTAPFAIR